MEVVGLSVLAGVLALLGDQLSPAVFAYVVQYHRICSGCRQKLEGSCSRPLLSSYVLRVLGGTL